MATMTYHTFPSDRAASVRLTARGRFVVRAAAVLVSALAVTWAGSLVVNTVVATNGAAPISTATVVVQAGDSLWSVAVEVAPDVDPRETVDVIRSLNQLGPDSLLQPGQTLIVPRL